MKIETALLGIKIVTQQFNSGASKAPPSNLKLYGLFYMNINMKMLFRATTRIFSNSDVPRERAKLVKERESECHAAFQIIFQWLWKDST